MLYFLPDGTPLAESDILDLADGSVVSDNRVDFSLALGESVDPAEAWAPMACPPPQKWRAVGTRRDVRGTTFYPVSPVYGPSGRAERITIESDRTVSKSASINGDLGVGISLLQAEIGVKLEA